jgi:hypothetical protein
MVCGIFATFAKTFFIKLKTNKDRSGGQVIDLLLSKRKHRIRNHLVFDPTTNINN